MAFEIDIGFTSLTGKKEINEDFAAAMLPEPGREAMGAIAAIADGVSMGGNGARSCADHASRVWCAITSARRKPGTRQWPWIASSVRRTPGWRA